MPGPNSILRTILYISNLTDHEVTAVSEWIRMTESQRWRLFTSFQNLRGEVGGGLPEMLSVMISEVEMGRFEGHEPAENYQHYLSYA